MESYQIKHLTFTYPNKEKIVLSDISLEIKQGEFVTLCGKSGCGKSTLLRHLKPCFIPVGKREGHIYFEGRPLDEIDKRTQSEKIGFVLQNPDYQIVTDKVWHELAFGLESLGYSTPEIRTRVSEMASFFGIQNWFHKSVTALSGGQKQLLNLASIMAMQPSVLILDEPTSQLDPIAAQDFLEILAKINRELGITIILTEHRLEEAFPMSDRVIVMDAGGIVADGTPYKVGELLKQMNHDMFAALPVPMRIYAQVPNTLTCPITVREGRAWLEKIDLLQETAIFRDKPQEQKGTPIVALKEVWFRYEKDGSDIVKDLNLQIYNGEFYAIVGGNGTGKTTSLSIISGLLKPYRGRVLFDGKKREQWCGQDGKILGVLPQDPQALFVKKTVVQDLEEILKDKKVTRTEKESLIQEVITLCELEDLLLQHPYDLSGGEQQRAALAKVLLLQPSILLLDEPTKGLDAHYKEKMAALLKRLQARGLTIIMVSHDIEFCAKYADRCAMFFDGNVVSEAPPRAFFAGKSFYTTATNRMARTRLPHAILAEDVIAACNGLEKTQIQGGYKDRVSEVVIKEKECEKDRGVIRERREEDIREVGTRTDKTENTLCENQKEQVEMMIQMPKENRYLSKRTLLATLIILLVIPLTIYVGIAFWGDRKYYFISVLIMIETFIPFLFLFENRKPQARELVVISVLCAIGVAGRAAFFMLPQFKPVVAVVIISGICFGGETGFLVGAITAFASNMFFGQGPWTPWQMFAFGIIGFFAGILFQKGFLRKTRIALCLFGGVTTFFIYGGIMNTASVIMWQAKPNKEMFISSYLMGIPFDFIHAMATVTFLFIMSKPMIEKLERIKVKYGIIEVS